MVGMILNGVYRLVDEAARLWFWYSLKTHREFESHYTPDKIKHFMTIFIYESVIYLFPSDKISSVRFWD